MCSPHGDVVCCGFQREREDRSVLLEKYVRKRRERMCSLVLMVCPADSKWGSEERARMVSVAFYVAWEGDPDGIAAVILIGQNI